MGDFKQTTLVFVSTLSLSALGLTWVAQAQTETQSSPFAKSGTQAWESGTTSSGNQAYQYPYGNTSSGTTTGSYQPSGNLQAPSAPAPTMTTSQAPSSSYSYQLPSISTGSSGGGSYTAPGTGSMNYGGSSAPQVSGPKVYSGGSTPTFSAGTATSQSAPTQPSTRSTTSSPYAVQLPQNTQTQQTQPQASATYSPGASYDYPSYGRTGSAAPQIRTQTPASSQSSGAYYPGRNNGAGAQAQSQARGSYYPQQAQYQNQQGTPSPYGAPAQAPKRSFSQKLGLDNVEFYYEGELAAGAAGTYAGLTDDWREDFILDGYVLGEVSAVTPGGLEYGVAAELRGQYDQYRRGFGGRVGDCPPNIVGCNGINVGGNDVSLRGHTSRFYASGTDDAKDFEAQLEGAHLFLRSAYGDVTVGRDDGAAYIFSLGAPSLLAVGASNSPVDYTGLDSVKTANDASGFAEKITYTSPRLLGDQIGVGIQVGASYALDAKACGVDYCVRDIADDPVGVMSSDIGGVAEFGVALDRKFSNGLSVEATATYAMGKQERAIADFDDLKALGLGLELGYGDFILGGSYLNSNNGLANGDYKAMDVGLTWQPSKLGFTVGYGHAKDDNVGLTSNQAVAGVTYDVNDMFRLGTGVQYVDRTVNAYNTTSTFIEERDEDAASLFIQGRIKF